MKTAETVPVRHGCAARGQTAGRRTNEKQNRKTLSSFSRLDIFRDAYPIRLQSSHTGTCVIRYRGKRLPGFRFCAIIFHIGTGRKPGLCAIRLESDGHDSGKQVRIRRFLSIRECALRGIHGIRGIRGIGDGICRPDGRTCHGL
ncbi:MAG: hypothetical protein ACYCYM_01525 [Saccharofermentanales bacterium]